MKLDFRLIFKLFRDAASLGNGSAETLDVGDGHGGFDGVALGDDLAEYDGVGSALADHFESALALVRRQQLEVVLSVLTKLGDGYS